jgi:hypothetical protein
LKLQRCWFPPSYSDWLTQLQPLETSIAFLPLFPPAKLCPNIGHLLPSWLLFDSGNHSCGYFGSLQIPCGGRSEDARRALEYGPTLRMREWALFESTLCVSVGSGGNIQFVALT